MNNAAQTRFKIRDQKGKKRVKEMKLHKVMKSRLGQTFVSLALFSRSICSQTNCCLREELSKLNLKEEDHSISSCPSVCNPLIMLSPSLIVISTGHVSLFHLLQTLKTGTLCLQVLWKQVTTFSFLFLPI